MALKLNPAPTFRAKVGIPVPGQEQPEQIVCIFRHMTREEYQRFSSPDELAKRSEVDTLMALMAGWEEVDEAFSRDAVARMVQAYHGAPFVIAAAFAAELTKARLGN